MITTTLSILERLFIIESFKKIERCSRKKCNLRYIRVKIFMERKRKGEILINNSKIYVHRGGRINFARMNKIND